jgi:hypothetical protein
MNSPLFRARMNGTDRLELPSRGRGLGRPLKKRGTHSLQPGDADMEQWLPLFRYLLAFPTANAAALLSSTSSDECPRSPHPAVALLRLLLSPVPTLPRASAEPRAAILFQTLPPFIQSQALSFLSSSASLLDPHHLRDLAVRIISASPGKYDFWVCRGARQLPDGLPEEEGEGPKMATRGG